jgi:hypothetical protein
VRLVEQDHAVEIRARHSSICWSRVFSPVPLRSVA